MQGGAAMKQAMLELVEQHRRLLIIAGILLLLNVLLLAVVSYYLNPAVISSQASWNDLRQRVAAAGKADARTLYRQGSDDLKKLFEHIPVRRQFPRIVGDILDTASSSGVVTGAVSYKPQAVKEVDIQAVNLSMTVTGGYAAIKSFLADLQKINDLVVVEDVVLSNTDLYEENISMDLKMTIYLQGKEGA
jgi:type IV pilus assembly protein PilO